MEADIIMKSQKGKTKWDGGSTLIYCFWTIHCPKLYKFYILSYYLMLFLGFLTHFCSSQHLRQLKRGHNKCNFTIECTCQLLCRLPPSGQPGKLPFLYHLYSEPKPFQHNRVATWGTYQAACNKTVINYIITH